MSLITVTGEALVDFVPDAQGVRQWTAGGSGLNTALALARLGIPTNFAGALSADENGAHLATFMREEGIDLSDALISDKPCPHVLVSKDAQGSPQYDLHLAGSALEDAPAVWTCCEETRHFHATSFAATLGRGGDAALASLRKAKPNCTTSFDPNIRASVFPDRASIPLLLAQRIRFADIVKVSSEDLFAIAPEILHDHVIAEWRALGPRLIIITRGAQGAVAISGTSQIEVPALQIDVCDTIGAGDTFMAAFLAAMSDDHALGTSSAWGDAKIARWLAFAARAASLSCTRAGADPPTRKMMDARR